MVEKSIEAISLEDILESLEQFSENELIVLSEAVADQVNRLRDANTRVSMDRFQPGDTVSFKNKKGDMLEGIVIRLNKKTVSVVTLQDERWNIAPQLLSPVKATALSHVSDNVDMRKGSSIAPLHPEKKRTHTHSKTEWVGGIVKAPGFVTGEGPAYQPKMLAWMDDAGFVVGMTVCKPDEIQQNIVTSLHEAIDKPVAGDSRPPTHLRVADKDLHRFLTDAFTHLEVSLAPTPEIDEMLNRMHEDMGSAGSPMTYLSLGLPHESIASFFTAAAKLYQVKPWQHVPNDMCLIGVTIKSLGIHDAVLIIIGQQQESYGFALFDSISHYDAYTDGVDCLTLGLPAEIPAHIALNFVPGAELEQSQRKEITGNGWKVANAQAYPDLFTPDSDHSVRLTTARDLDITEALSRALAEFFKKPTRLKDTWTNGQKISETRGVLTYRGPLEVTLTAPFPFERAYINQYKADSPMLALVALARSDTSDHDAYLHPADALEAEFMASPEGAPFTTRFSVVDLIQQFAWNYYRDTAPTLLASGLDDIIFDILPGKVMVEPDDASDIIKSTQAFYRFLKREYQLPQADSCLHLLDNGAVQRLRDTLKASSQFGIAKTLFAQASDRGFDMKSQEGIEAWMESTGGHLPNDLDLPVPPTLLQSLLSGYDNKPPTPPKPIDQKARKKKRKAARKARKRK